MAKRLVSIKSLAPITQSDRENHEDGTIPFMQSNTNTHWPWFSSSILPYNEIIKSEGGGVPFYSPLLLELPALHTFFPVLFMKPLDLKSKNPFLIKALFLSLKLMVK